MSFAQIIAFVPAAFILALAPGPDNLGVLALGVSHGRSASLGFALGCATGCINHTLLAVIGVSALIAASPTAFHIMQYFGASYLAWLGIKMLTKKKAATVQDCAIATVGVHTFKAQFRRGLIANAINPKVALFFLAFLPQFVRPALGSGSLQLMVLGILFAAISALVFALIALFSAHIGAWLKSHSTTMRWAERMSGFIFIGLAIRLAMADGLPAAVSRHA